MNAIRKDAETNKTQILTATEALFQQGKLSDIGMREIAKAAGIGVGTLYRHYPTKSALHLGLVYSHLDQFLADSIRQRSISLASDRTAFENFLHQYLLFRESNADLLLQVDQDFQLGQQFYQSPQFHRLVGIIEEYLGHLLPDEQQDSLTFKAEMLIAMLKSDIYAYERTTKGHSQEDLIARFVSFFT